MNINQDDIKFLQYDARITKKLRQLWKNKNDLELVKYVKLIDDDHIKIKEDHTMNKKPRIGKEFQAIIPDFT